MRLQHDLRTGSAILNQVRRIRPGGLTDLLVHKNARMREWHSTQLHKCFRQSVLALQGHT